MRALVVAVVSFPLLATGPAVLNPDGAWCWFQDDRAVVHGGKLSVSSITRAGQVQITTWDFKTGALNVATLRSNFDRDDHNAAGLLLRHDGRLMAFYARHNREPLMYHRLAARPGDAADWEPEQSYDGGLTDRFTYANPFQLASENNRIYNFWRGKDFNPTWSASDDGGRSWRPAANHIYFRKGERPYVKYASNGVDTIHFVFTEGHPNRPYKTSLYHAFYRRGGLYRSDGTFIRKLEERPVTPAEATRIYDGENTETGEAWVWDVALDRSGRPVVVYSTHPSPEDHRYRYARWNGKAWDDRQIAFAGRRLYKAEGYYSGGIALDPDDLRVVYLSSNVNIRDGQPSSGGRYEIYRGSTRDGGHSWKWRPLTTGSSHDNLRPIVPPRHPKGVFVLWFRGVYRAYTDYETEVVAYTDAKLPLQGARP